MTRSCALCGTPAQPPFRPPPPETAPDLDQRPGEPTRSTLRRWLQVCRGCGACAPDVATLDPGRAALTGTPAYTAAGSNALRWAQLVAGTPSEGEALLQAAWEADDAGRPAAELRRRAADCLPHDDPRSALRRVDVLRRAGQFDEAAAALDASASNDDASRTIAAFLRERIAAGDGNRYMISSALRPAVRTPHASHGAKPAKRGLLRWLRG